MAGNGAKMIGIAKWMRLPAMALLGLILLKGALTVSYVAAASSTTLCAAALRTGTAGGRATGTATLVSGWSSLPSQLDSHHGFPVSPRRGKKKSE